MRKPSNGRFDSAAAEAKRVVRRAGAKYNGSDDAALRSALSAAADQGLLRLLCEWGAWRFRFDVVPRDAGAVLAEVEQAADAGADASAAMDVDEQVSQPAAAGSSRAASLAVGAAAQPAVGSSCSAATAVASAAEEISADEVARLRAKADHARSKKKEQRKRQRERKAAEKAAEATAAATAAAAPVPSPAAAFTFGSAPAATSAGASRAFGSAPAAPSAGATLFTMGSAGPSTATARPAACGAAAKPPGLDPSAATHPRQEGQGPPIYVPAFGGHMPYAWAYKRLIEAVTAAHTSRARGHCVPRTCLFPRDRVQQGVSYEVMLSGASRGARMSESDLGRRLAASIDGGLTDAALAELVEELFTPSGPAAPRGSPTEPPGVPRVGPFAVPRPRCGPGSGRSLVDG
jgi:hypothetical protein